MYNDMFHCYCIIQNSFSCPWNPVLASCSPCPTPATVDIFAVSIALPFPECYVVGIIQYISFFRLASFSWQYAFMVLEVSSWLNSLFYHWIILCCMDVVQLFIHSPTEGHLGYFQVLTIINKAAINVFCININFQPMITVIGLCGKCV